LEKQRAGWLWGLQALSGLLLLLLLGSHMVAQHYLVEGGLRTYADVVAYLRNPRVRLWEALFLFVVTPNAMLCLRAVALDLGLSPRGRRWVEGVLIIIGLGIVGYELGLIANFGGLG